MKKIEEVEERRKLRRIFQETGNNEYLNKYRKHLEKIGEKSDLLELYKKLKY